MPGSDADRARIIAHARRLRSDIEQIFTDCEHWNTLVRAPNEAPLDPDPDGTLRHLANGLDRQLAEDVGSGPIPPIGGWAGCGPK